MIHDRTTVSWSKQHSTTSYEYSPLDLLTKVTDAQGNISQMAYDSLGRKTQMVDADMGTWSYTYDVDGNLVTQTDAKNQTITFGYDALSRLTSKSSSPGGSVTYLYDQSDMAYHRNGRGQRTGMIDASGAQPCLHLRWRGQCGDHRQRGDQ